MIDQQELEELLRGVEMVSEPVPERPGRWHWLTARWGVPGAALLGLLLPQAWTSPGSVIAAGDTGLPLAGLRNITRFWGDQYSGTGSTTTSSAMLLERGLVSLVDALGGSPALAQRLWFAIVFAVTAAAVAWLAGAFVQRQAAMFAAGAVAVLNPFHLTTLPNLLPLVCIGAVAMVVGMAARLFHDRPVHPAFGVVIGVWVAELARNPPLLVLFAAVAAGAMLAVLVWGPNRMVAVRCAAWCAGASLFWAVPLGLHFLTGTPGLEVVAETGSNWDWTQRHSGPGNVVSLVASWVWGDPDVLTATARLARPPWSWMRFALPLAVLASLVLTWRRTVTRVVAAAAAVLVVLCTGVNWPFGPLNRFLSGHIPGFWLFRQPMSKFGVLLVVCMALAVGLGVQAVADRWAARDRGSTAMVSGGAALAVVAVAFVHPLLVGTVLPGEREYLPPAEVRVPDSLVQTGRALDEAPGEGSTLVLPLSEYYQRGTVWGYYGVDDVIGRMSTRPALFLLPDGYYEPAGASPALMRLAEDTLVQRDTVAFVGAMEALGARYLAVRTDVTAAYGRNRTFRDGTVVDEAAAAAGLTLVESSEYLRVYEVPTAARFDGATSRWSVGVPDGHDEGDAMAAAAAVAGGSTVVTDHGGDAIRAVAWQPEPGEAEWTADLPAGTYRANAVVRGPLLWSIDGDAGGLTVTLASRASIGGTALLAAEPVAVEPTAPPLGVLVGGRMVPLDDGLFQASSGAVVTVLGAPGDIVDFDGIQVGNCNNRDGLPTAAEAGIEASVIAGGVRLSAARDAACVLVPVVPSDPVDGHRIWHLRAEFRASDAGAARLCLWIPSLLRCAAGTALTPAGTSGTVDLLVDTLGDDMTDAGLVLYADHDGGSAPVDVQWRDVVIEPLSAVGELTLPPLATSAGDVTLDGPTPLRVGDDVGNLVGDFGDDVGDCNDYDDDPVSLRTAALPDEPQPAVALQADRHSACVWAPVTVRAGVRDVTLSFSYRSEAGRSARYAVVDGAGDVTLASGSLPEAAEWTEFDVPVTLPVSDPTQPADRVRVYLYADGAGRGQSAVDATAEYRAVRVAPPVATAVVVAQAVDGASRVHVTETGGDTATITAEGGEVVFVFRQAYADGWQLDGLPSGVSSRHVMVDGWANGWVVSGLEGATADLRVTYRLSGVVSMAVWSIVLVVAAAVATVVAGRWRRRRIAMEGADGDH